MSSGGGARRSAGRDTGGAQRAGRSMWEGCGLMAEGEGRAAGARPGGEERVMGRCLRGGGAGGGGGAWMGQTRGAAERRREAAPLSPPQPRPSAPRPRRSDGPSRALPLCAVELALTSSADRAVPPPPPPLPRPGK